MAVQMSTAEDVQAWTQYLGQCVRLLERFSWLADAYMLDFFVSDLWSALPAGWGPVLDACSPQQLAWLLSVAPPGHGPSAPADLAVVAPLSLLSYRAACSALSLPRRPLASPQPVAEFCRLSASAAAPPSGEQWPVDAAAELTPGGGQLKLLEHVFRRHVKPKKQHELRRVAGLVELVGGRLVVDVGSGQGHLSRYLAYGRRLPVVCLEADGGFVAGARRFDQQLETALRKRSGVALPEPPVHVALRLTADLEPAQLAAALARVTGGPASYRLVGLHTCGDLAPLMLRQFTACGSCAGLVSVGCCYMKLSGGGYPLSAALRRLASEQGYWMSYQAREMACHAVEQYRRRLGSAEQLERLRIHAYRAALERALVRHDPALRHSGLRSVPHAHRLPFHQYASRALAGLPLDPRLLDLSQADSDLAQWRRVVAFYSVRLLLAPVVETALLLDRMLYLYEHGHSSLLLPAFDPALSPRNFVLISTKPS